MIHPVDAPLVYAQRHVERSIGLDRSIGLERSNSQNRRTVYSARSSELSAVPTSPQIRDDCRGIAMWNQLLRSMGRTPIAGDHTADAEFGKLSPIRSPKKVDVLYFAPPSQPPSIDSPLELESAELNIGANATVHRTNNFHIVQRSKLPQLALRRGFAFRVDFSFYRNYDPTVDSLNLILEIGELPTAANATKIVVPISARNDRSSSDKLRRIDWSAEIAEITDRRLTVDITIASNAIVGCWNMKLVSSLKRQKSSDFSDSVSLIRGIYILFNPWCPEDLCFMKNDEERDEYVLNDNGKIWRGSHNTPRPVYWNFGQFEPDVLEACFTVLDNSRLPLPQRANPFQIAKLVSQMVNSVDGDGVLIGNWSSEFGNGTPPTDWAGSVKILRNYAEHVMPIAYGQCWVFAGVVTTVLRCLGIPSRVVTNYSSAHDTGTTVSINLHINNCGKIDRTQTTDSLWCYHVWNECWLARPDLPEEYSGWQALDATPQEKSDGLYSLGPTSIRAVHDGRIGYSCDTSFLFAEVNAQKYYWLMGDDGSERLIDIKRDEVGQRIVTKSVGRKFVGMSNSDALDITSTYKYEGSEEDRRAILEKVLPGYRLPTTNADALNSEQSTADVKFSWSMGKSINLGEDFDVVVSMENASKEPRTVKISLRIESMQYFGGELHKIRSETKVVSLAPGEVQEAKLNITVRDYIGKAMPQFAFLLTSLARVIQTGQIYASTEDIRIKTPDVVIRVNEPIKVGHTSTVTLELVNPLPVMLTKCKFSLEGPGILDGDVVRCRDVSPRGLAKAECRITPWRSIKDLVLVARFSSDQLHDVDGATHCTVV